MQHTNGAEEEERAMRNEDDQGVRPTRVIEGGDGPRGPVILDQEPSGGFRPAPKAEIVEESERGHFVEPETVERHLADGTFIELKLKLTYGEQQRLKSAGLTTMRANAQDNSAEIGTDFARFDMAKIECWVVDWGLKDRRGRVRPPSRESIENLDPDVAEEILEIINDYVAERDAQKKMRLISSGSSPR
jgi:hypothetical protein